MKIKTIIILLFFLGVANAQRIVYTNMLTDTLNNRLATFGDSIAVSSLINDSLGNATWKYIDKTTWQNISTQKNFLGGLKVGTDSTLRISKDSVVFQNVNKGIRYRFADVNNSFWTGSHRTLYDDRPDYIHYLSSYNSTPSGNRINTADASLQIFVESNYLSGADTLMEYNIEAVLANGVSFRPYQFSFRRDQLGLIAHQFTGKVQFKTESNDSVAIDIHDYGYDGRTRLRWNNVTNGARFDMYLKENTAGSDLVLWAGSNSTPSMQWGGSKTKVNGELFLTSSDLSMTSNTDTALTLNITSPGYGFIKSKNELHLQSGWVHFDDFAGNTKASFYSTDGSLHLGGYTIGTGKLYVGEIYLGSTKIIDTNLVFQNISNPGQRYKASGDTTIINSKLAISNDYNSANPDTSIVMNVTSPGYGYLKIKNQMFYQSGWHIWDNYAGANRMIFYANDSSLTIGSLYQQGGGRVYAGSYYAGTTKVIDANADATFDSTSTRALNVTEKGTFQLIKAESFDFTNIPTDSTTVTSGYLYMRASDGIIRRKY